MSEPIICGLDGEPHSLRALQVANELAVRSGRRLELLHITRLLVVVGPSRRGRIRGGHGRISRVAPFPLRGASGDGFPAAEAALGPAERSEARAQARPA